MSDATAILCTWNGEAFEPAGPSWVRRANDSLVVGERYFLEVQEIRSAASHKHYFASIREAFVNLPEHLAERFGSADALRKYALIRAGYRDERSIVCASKAEADRVASFIRPMDDFAVVTVSNAVVTVYTAKSQSARAMGKRDFQASKDAVLDCIAQMIGVSTTILNRNAGEAA